jgi:hypothetical protein
VHGHCPGARRVHELARHRLHTEKKRPSQRAIPPKTQRIEHESQLQQI